MRKYRVGIREYPKGKAPVDREVAVTAADTDDALREARAMGKTRQVTTHHVYDDGEAPKPKAKRKAKK